MDDSAHTKAAYAFIDTRTSSLSLWGHYIGEYTRSLLSSSVLLLPLCLFAPFFSSLSVHFLSVWVWVCVRAVGWVGGNWGDSPFSFVFISLIYFCSQMWTDTHHSVQPSQPDSPSSFHQHPRAPPTLLLGGQASTQPPPTNPPPTLSSASPTPPPPLNPFSIAQDECVFKAEIDCGYQSYGAIHHSRYYSDEQDWTRRWDSWAHGWVLGGRWALNLEGV